MEFPKMVELAMAGRLKVADLVTKRRALDVADEAFRALAAREQVPEGPEVSVGDPLCVLDA